MTPLNSVDTPAPADVPKELPYLAMGESSFTALRTMDGVYVDKTDLIFGLARSKRFVFLSRPRRFGKSLLSSSFASLFRSGTKDFRGLKIEKLWNDTGLYRVLELDFSLLNSESSDAFSLSLRDAVSERVPEAKLSGCDDPFGWIAKFGFWLESQPVVSMVVLIDEYDAPLVDCLENPVLFNAIQKKMSEFFRTLKSRSGCLRFFFMTGISKFTNTSIFSTFNYLLWDISNDPQYGTLLGFTETEIRRHFRSHLANASQQLGMTVDELMDNLRLNYDGYCFDEQNSTHVFSNWSILNFFNSPKRKFKNYWWMSAGQPSVLMKYLKRNAFVGMEKYDALIPVAK
ncbi:MAG: AAA family ATPase, partial [Sutterella sp.]